MSYSGVYAYILIYFVILQPLQYMQQKHKQSTFKLHFYLRILHQAFIYSHPISSLQTTFASLKELYLPLQLHNQIKSTLYNILPHLMVPVQYSHSVNDYVTASPHNVYKDPGKFLKMLHQSLNKSWV
jgi:hypothetical protein